mmetsp:Transcript_36455/g.102968  ORF Transcript_36455/g.102968 Transcript_36455/m.102968 type:complete len:147 (-) Transcript_36455:426-866(-)
MIQRGKEPEKGVWSFPGGRLELGETIVGCAIRELREETGLVLRCRDLPPSQEMSHLGSPLSTSENLDTPVPFTAVDVVVRSKDSDAVTFHYAIIEVAGVPEDPQAPVVAGDDAADAAWVAVEDIPSMGASLNCDTVAMEAARRFRI